jgi:hypothetical protein
MRNQILVIILILFVSSCVPEESKNDLDPANICGGISASSVGMRIGSIESRNAVYESDGIHFDLYASFKNCFGREVRTISPAIVSSTPASISTYLTPTISSLSKDASSNLVRLASLVFDPILSNSTNFSIGLLSSEGSTSLSSSLNLANFKPDFVVDTDSFQLLDGANSTNGDLQIDPGETISFKLKISNLSDVKIKSLSSSISTSSGYFSITSGAAQSFGDLTAKATTIASTTTLIAVDPLTPRGSIATFNITLTDQFSHSWTKTINLQVSSTIAPPRKTQVLSLGSTSTFKGFSVDSSYWYFLSYESLGNGVNYWRFYKKSPSSTSFTYMCGLLDDGVLKGNLAIDSNYFYVGQEDSIRRINRSNCSPYETITPSSLDYDSRYFDGVYPFSLSVDGGNLFYGRFSKDLTSYNLSTFKTNSFSTKQSLSSKTLDPVYAQYIVNSGVRWVHDQSNNLIWKLDSSNIAQSWGALPISSFSDLRYSKAIGTQNGTSLVMATEEISNTIKFASVDITGLSSDPVTGVVVNTNQELISLGTSDYSACAPDQFVTSAQKCFSLSSNATLTLAAGLTFTGFAADSTYFYLATKNASNLWTFYRKLKTDTTWNTLCSLTDTSLKGNLAVDATYFYVGQADSIRRINRSNCSPYETITPSSLDYDSRYFNVVNTFSLSTDGGKMYFSRFSGDLTSFDLSTLSYSDFTTAQRLGAKSLNPSASQYIVYAGTRWGYDRTNKMLWKLNSSNTALSWGALPTSNFDDLNYVYAIATQDGTTIAVATQKTAGTIKFYYFDVSNF